MFDMHKRLNEFYADHVRLGKERQTLAEHRDTNLDRLKAGLQKLEHPSSFDHRNQGSYAMHTINQRPEKDYDIDVAIIFSKDDLPSSALDARKRIEEAMQEGGGNFSQPPEAKTNAVGICRKPMSAVQDPTHAAVNAPTSTCPSMPMLKSPPRMAKANASPVNIRGIA